MTLHSFTVELHVAVRSQKNKTDGHGALLFNHWMEADVIARNAESAIRLARDAAARRKRVPSKDVTCKCAKLRATATGNKERVVKLIG
jgi:hypothetical protein